jgi:hypothetical protein
MAPEITEPLLDDATAAVPAAIADLERQLTELALMLETPAARKAMTGLRDSWTGFVELLDLPATAELRRCPACKHVGMRAATRCGYCWTKLDPPA